MNDTHKLDEERRYEAQRIHSEWYGMAKKSVGKALGRKEVKAALGKKKVQAAPKVRTI